MSTRDYLKELDYDQLIFARDEAISLLKEKDNQSKIPLLIVSDAFMNYAAFKVEDYDLAIEKLIQEIRREGADKHSSLELAYFITKKYVREDEVNDWLRL